MSRWRASTLVALLTCIGAGGHAQRDAATAAPEFRLLETTTGRTIASSAQTDVLDVSSLGLGPLSFDTVAVPEGYRSVRYELDGVPFAVVDVPPAAEGTLEVRVGRSEDDAEEFLAPSAADPQAYPRGFTYVTSSDLELTFDPPHANQIVGVRFADVELPTDARVLAAQIVFTADGSSDGDVELTIAGERSPQSASFVQDDDGIGSFGISSRPRTASSVSWSVEERWASGAHYATPDLTHVVDEIVGLDGWQSGNALTFLISSPEGDTLRRAFAFDGRRDDPDRVPRLRIGFETASAPSSTPTFDAPAGVTLVTATPFTSAGGTGAAGPVARFTLVNEPGGAADESARETPMAEPAPAVTPAPVAAPVVTDTPIDPDAGFRYQLESQVAGAVRLIRDGPTHTLVIIDLDEPAPGPLGLSLRAGTCAAPGATLVTLQPVGPAESASRTRVGVPTTALRLGGFVAWIAVEPAHVPIACASLLP